VEGLEVVEMPNSGTRSICCGTSLWMNCSWISKDMQIARLQEAVDTGSQMLITTCPKCLIHFRCAMDENGDGDGPEIEVKDLVTLLAESMEKE
jgi:Fe-S oxidoreductase